MEGQEQEKPAATAVGELKPLAVRKIDFTRFAPAANKTIEALVLRVNELLEIAKEQAAELEELKKN